MPYILHARSISITHYYGKINWGHTVCPLYGGGPYLGESVMGGSTVTYFLTYDAEHSNRQI